MRMLICSTVEMESVTFPDEALIIPDKVVTIPDKVVTIPGKVVTIPVSGTTAIYMIIDWIMNPLESLCTQNIVFYLDSPPPLKLLS